MYKFNLPPVKLEDKKYCNGCPLLRLSDIYPLSWSYNFCRLYEKETKKPDGLIIEGSQSFGWKAIRPDICLENEV